MDGAHCGLLLVARSHDARTTSGISNTGLPASLLNPQVAGGRKFEIRNSKFEILLLCLALIGTAACAHRGAPPVRTEPAPPQAPPMQSVEKNWTEKGIASWYGEPYHGRRTASGEVYDMHAFTAAHRSLPFGTVVEVRRRDSGAEVTVRINDRGPFIAGRIIDLSYAAAKRVGLDVDGIAEVTIRVVGRKDPPPRAAAPPQAEVEETCFWVQVGAFGEVGNARRAQEALADADERAVVLEGLDELFRVRLGPFTEVAAAERARNRVTDAWPGARVVPCGG
jgi:rare lipoprotein A